MENIKNINNNMTILVTLPLGGGWEGVFYSLFIAFTGFSVAALNA